MGYTHMEHRVPATISASVNRIGVQERAEQCAERCAVRSKAASQLGITQLLVFRLELNIFSTKLASFSLHPWITVEGW